MSKQDESSVPGDQGEGESDGTVQLPPVAGQGGGGAVDGEAGAVEGGASAEDANDQEDAGHGDANAGEQESLEDALRMIETLPGIWGGNTLDDEHRPTLLLRIEIYGCEDDNHCIQQWLQDREDYEKMCSARTVGTAMSRRACLVWRFIARQFGHGWEGCSSRQEKAHMEIFEQELPHAPMLRQLAKDLGRILTRKGGYGVPTPQFIATQQKGAELFKEFLMQHLQERTLVVAIAFFVAKKRDCHVFGGFCANTDVLRSLVERCSADPSPDMWWRS